METLVDSRFWKARSEYDAEELFADATLLWTAACDYFDWCDGSPLIDRVAGKDGKVIEKELIRAFTMQGLCNYMNCSVRRFDLLKEGLSEPCSEKCKLHCDSCNKNVVLEVVERIQDAIYQQKLEAAAAGLLNATIIGRDIGFTGKEKDLNNLSPVILDFSDDNKADA
jgi:hypothetical protein